jgi:hypothetical protein
VPPGQHAAKLGQRCVSIVDRAQDQRGDGTVEALVVERKPLRGRAHDARLDAGRRHPALQASRHRLLRLGHHELLQPRRVEREVDAGTSPDLDHAPVRGGEQLASAFSQSGLLAASHDPVVDSSKDTPPDIHV